MGIIENHLAKAKRVDERQRDRGQTWQSIGPERWDKLGDNVVGQDSSRNIRERTDAEESLTFSEEQKNERRCEDNACRILCLGWYEGFLITAKNNGDIAANNGTPLVIFIKVALIKCASQTRRGWEIKNPNFHRHTIFNLSFFFARP